MRLDSQGNWKGHSLTDSWVRVDMLNTYTVIGLTMVINNFLQYDLKVSTDKINYQYIDQNITAHYLPGDDYTTYWFKNPAQG